MRRLKRRAEFVAAASGRKFSTSCFLLQARAREPGEDPDAMPAPEPAPAREADGRSGRDARFGFTVTRKTGGAVERNRIRRRLREAVRQVGPVAARAGHDYVLVGRRAALTAPFEAIVKDLERALRAVHRPPDRAAAPGGKARRRNPPDEPRAPSHASSGGRPGRDRDGSDHADE
jgi:ribonuclease P protein component